MNSLKPLDEESKGSGKDSQKHREYHKSSSRIKEKNEKLFNRPSKHKDNCENRKNSSELSNSNQERVNDKQKGRKSVERGIVSSIPLQKYLSEIDQSKENSNIDKKDLHDYFRKLEDLNKRMGSCPCYSKRLYFNNQITRAVPIIFIENIQEETDETYIEKRQDLQKLLICLLNEGGGFVFIGRKLKNDMETNEKEVYEQENNEQYEFEKETDWLKEHVTVPKQLRLFYKTEIQKKKSFVQKVISELVSQIKSDSAFEIFIDEVKFKEYISGTEIGLRRNEFALRVKLVPKDKRKFFYLENELGREQIRFTFCRKLNGETFFVDTKQMYKLSHLIFKHGSVDSYLFGKISNHIDINFVVSRISQFTEFHKDILDSKDNKSAEEEGLTCILIPEVGYGRKIVNRSETLLFFEKEGISFSEFSFYNNFERGASIFKFQCNMPMENLIDRMRWIQNQKLVQVTKTVSVSLWNFKFQENICKVSQIKTKLNCFDCKVKKTMKSIEIGFKTKSEAVVSFILLFKENFSPTFCYPE